MRAKLGQHMMVSKKWIKLIADLLDVRGDEVIELGAGTGNLSEEILSRDPKKLILVEKDERLVEVLRERFEGDERVEIVKADIRDLLPLRVEKIASNPPYYLSSQLIIGLARSEFKRAVLTLQKEFAERLVAKPGTERYGSLSVIASLLLKVSLVSIVDRRSFSPVPKVDSAILVIEPKQDELRDQILKYCKLVFSRRKRELKNSLKPFLKDIDGLPHAERRPYHMSPEEVREVIAWLSGKLGD